METYGTERTLRGSPVKKRRTREPDDRTSSSWLLRLPRDLWALIRDLQGAEEAVRFALVCRESLAIVKSHEFWHQWPEPVFDLSNDSPRRKAVFYFFVRHCLEVGRPLLKVSFSAPYRPADYIGQLLDQVTVDRLVMIGNIFRKQPVEERNLLNEFAGIRQLSATNTSDICQHLRDRANTRGLRSLTLSMQNVTDDSLRVLSTLPDLESLTLRRCNLITDAGLQAALAPLPKLRELCVKSCTGICGTRLRGLLRLTKLTLSQPALDSTIEEVSLLSELKELDLFGCNNISGHNLELLRDHRFDCLRLRCSGSTNDSQLQVLSRLRGLRALHLKATPYVTVYGLANLRVCPALEQLVLEDCNQFEDLGVLQEIRALRTLQLIGTNGNQGPPPGFVACQSVQKLQLDRYGLSDETIASLRLLPLLEELELSECTLTGNVLGLQHCRSLRTLVMLSCAGVSAESRQALARARPDLSLRLSLEDMVFAAPAV